MGLLASIGHYVRSLPKRLTAKIGPYRWTDPGVTSIFGGHQASAGVQVDADKAMSLSAVFAGVNLYSQIMASLPLNVYRRTGQKKQIAENLRLQSLLSVQPNPEMSAFTFRRTQEFHRLLWGNEYAEIEWGDDGQPVALWPILPWRVRPERDLNTRELYYVVDGRKMAPEDLLTNTLVSADGVCGRSFVWYAIDSLGIGIAGQDLVGAFFANGARPGGILKHPGSPDQKARDLLRQSWSERHGGASNTNKTGVIWGGWEYEDKGGTIPPDKAQLLESRRFFTEEVARWLNIPPALLHDLSRATFGNVEEQGINLVVYSFGPVLVSKEQEYDRKLCRPPKTFTKHKIEGLLRAKSSERAAYLKEMFMIGGKTINEILDLEDENHIGPDGDVRFVPANMNTLERAIAGPAPAPSQAPPPGAAQPNQSPQSTPPAQTPPALPAPAQGQGMRSALKALLADTLGRMLRKECNAARRAATEPGKLFAWMDQFYPAHAKLLLAALEQPCFVAWQAAGSPRVGIDGGKVVAALIEASQAALLELADRTTAATFAGEAEKLFAAWEEARPGIDAERILEQLEFAEPLAIATPDPAYHLLGKALDVLAAKLQQPINLQLNLVGGADLAVLAAELHKLTPPPEAPPPAPVINNIIQVPETPPPAITNIVNVPEAPPPVVNVAPAKVDVLVDVAPPAPPPPRQITVKRDAKGDMIGANVE